MKKVFAFDLGKTSIGYCVREDFDIKKVGSVIIDIDHAEVLSNRDRRRVNRTYEAHKAREKFFNDLWIECGLTPLNIEDEKFKKEFDKSDIIYNSCLLRIALLQNKPLEEWQIYKALHSAFQRRGYDSKLPWANDNSKNDDDKKNKELANKYTQENDIELINDEKYKYPCYYDAKRLGLWNEENPERLNKSIPLSNNAKVRTNGLVAPRNLVEKELKILWENAKTQIPELKNISAEYFLYGEYNEAYGSYKEKEFKKYRGTEHDWQGVLGQKIPRFDNRIIAKCKLLPKRNVCKANCLENVSFTLLMKLKNLRLTDINNEKFRLSPDEIKTIYENWLIKAKADTKDEKLDVTITKKEIETVIGKKINDKLEPMKANISGRSAFCRRACKIMTKFILSGELYPQNIDISEFVDKDTAKNPITEEEIKTMLSRIGDGNNLYIPDNRDEMAKITCDKREKTDILIGNITNPIVRNRLQIFRDLMLDLKEQYKEPDEVIFEFVREGADNSLFGKVKADNHKKRIEDNYKKNQQIEEKLRSDCIEYSQANFDKMKLLEIQLGQSIYSGHKISPSDIDKCEIDHIYPRTYGGNDAIYNRVLCYREENQEKKGRTPYEWLHNDEKRWTDYCERLNNEVLKKSLGKIKYELLTSEPEDCAKLIDSYNGLAETAQIAHVAQQITAMIFGWGLQVEGQNRKIFVNNGSSTAAIRKTYRLNSLLGNDREKNRKNDKHHALDAICISFSRDYKYNKDKKKDEIAGLNPEIIAKAIDELIPYPYVNKRNKPYKCSIGPEDHIYGKRTILNKNKSVDCMVIKKELISFILNDKGKLINIDKNKLCKKFKNNIIDNAIKKDLIGKLDLGWTKEQWFEYLKNYTHPTKKTHVKKVLTIVSRGTCEKDSNNHTRLGEFVDFSDYKKNISGQFKKSKQHKGQILYYNEKGVIKVMPVYANKKTQEVKDKLLEMNCKLYNNGQMFYSNCLVEIPNKFKAGQNTFPAGIYKLRTIMSNGGIKLENNCGIELMTMANNLTEVKFKKYTK